MTELLFQILTGLSLVFAGIIIGYFLWFRDRAEGVALCQKLSEENKAMTRIQHENVSTIADLKEGLKFERDQHREMRAYADEVILSREVSLQEAQRSRVELQECRTQLENSRAQLTQELQLRTQSEQQLHVAKQEHADTILHIEQEWRARHAKSESLLAHHDVELARLQTINSELEEVRRQSEAQNRQLQAEIDAQRQALELAIVHAQGFEQECVSLESTRQAQMNQLNDVQSAATQANAAKKDAEESLRLAREEIAVLEERCQQAEQSLAEQKSAATVVGATNDSAPSDTADRDSELDMILSGLAKRSENQETTIKQLRTRLARAEDQLVQRSQDVEAGRKELQRQAEQVEIQSTELAQEYRLRLDTVLQQRDEALDQVKGLHADLTRLRIHAESDESTIRNLRKERSEVLLQARKHKTDFPRIHGADLKELQFADELSKAYGGTTKSDYHRGVIFLEPPRRKDDLQKIDGIDAALAAQLNELGVFAFGQISAWTDEMVLQFSDLLSLSDHVHRDHWRQQAGELHDQVIAARDVA